LPAKLGQTAAEDAIFSVEVSTAFPVLRCGGQLSVSINPSGGASRKSAIVRLMGAKFKGPSMSIRFEGKPQFYLGIAEGLSAHSLDGSVVLRATISAPELRPKSVPVQFIVAKDVATALAEQLPIAVRMAELQKQQGA
jgi:hypothetical protein